MSLNDLKSLILSDHPLVIMDSDDEQRGAELLESACEALGLPLYEWSSESGLRSGQDAEPLGIRTECPLKALACAEEFRGDAVFLFHHLSDHFGDPGLRFALREALAKFRFSRSCLALAGADLNLPAGFEADAAWIQVHRPDAEEIGQLLDESLREAREHGAFQTKLTASERDAVIHAMLGMTRNQARQSLNRAIFQNHKLDATTISANTRAKFAAMRDGGLIEFFPANQTETETETGIEAGGGGFENLREWLKTTGQTAKAILVTGVAGCGKSLAARVVADWKRLPLIKIDAVRLDDDSIGDLEENFARAAEVAGSLAPCVVWIEAIERAIGDVANPRILPVALQWIRERNPAIFIVATTGDLQQLPVDLLRHGRFDEFFFVDLPRSGERVRIWQAQLRERKQDPAAFDLGYLVEATDGFSRDEIEQAIVAALCRAREQRRQPDTQLLIHEIYGVIPRSMSHASEISKIRREALKCCLPAARQSEHGLALVA